MKKTLACAIALTTATFAHANIDIECVNPRSADDKFTASLLELDKADTTHPAGTTTDSYNGTKDVYISTEDKVLKETPDNSTPYLIKAWGNGDTIFQYLTFPNSVLSGKGPSKFDIKLITYNDERGEKPSFGRYSCTTKSVVIAPNPEIRKACENTARKAAVALQKLNTPQVKYMDEVIVQKEAFEYDHYSISFKITFTDKRDHSGETSTFYIDTAERTWSLESPCVVKSTRYAAD